MIGRTVSHYRILSQLGAGGMGVVYRAEDVRLGREVAVKFVSEDYLHDEQAIQRLRSEARAASALNHPNICTIFDVGEDNGHPFIVMELMKGQTLRDKLLAGPLKVHQLIDIGIEIADALHSTHSDGIIHRDVKPGNIFLTERGHVKILDFGLAKLTPRFVGANSTAVTVDQTLAGMTLGTISYMSPEQATGEELDGRTDLFSLGVVLYECATGKHPFPGKTSAVVLSAILSRAPVAPISINPDLPLRLQEIINNCLEKDRELRYQSAADLRADLKRLRRDIESGHSRSVTVVPNDGATVMVASASRTARVPVRDDRPTTYMPAASSAGSSGSTAAAGSTRWVVPGIAAAVVGVVGVGAWFLLPREGSNPPALATEVPAASVADSRLTLARASLDARNYRAAIAYTAEVLAEQADHEEARAIRDQAQQLLARADAAVAEARTRLAARDVAATARALEEARELDPASPAVAEVSAALNELVRDLEAAGRASAARKLPEPAATARAAAPVTPSVTPPAPAASRGTGVAPPGASSAPTDAGASTSAPPPQSAGNQSASPGSAAASPAPQQPPTQPAPTPPTAASEPPPAPTAAPTAGGTASAPASPAPAASSPAPPAARAAESDEAAIRRLVAIYGRAIENKDIAMFRSVKPNLSRDEERRLLDGFRAVTSQQVTLTVTSLTQRGDTASVALRRRDVITAGGRQYTSDTEQMLSLARGGGGWVITEIR